VNSILSAIGCVPAATTAAFEAGSRWNCWRTTDPGRQLARPPQSKAIASARLKNDDHRLARR